MHCCLGTHVYLCPRVRIGQYRGNYWGWSALEGRAGCWCWALKANMELCNNSRQTTKMNFLTNVRFVSALMITHTRHTTTTTRTITKQDEGDTYRNWTVHAVVVVVGLRVAAGAAASSSIPSWLRLFGTSSGGGAEEVLRHMAATSDDLCATLCSLRVEPRSSTHGQHGTAQIYSQATFKLLLEMLQKLHSILEQALLTILLKRKHC